MKASFNWLKEFVDIDLNPYQLADKLTLSGLEVESVFDLGKACYDSVVGLCKSVERISDKLHLLSIDTGNKINKIVTSDTQIKKGDKIGVVIAGTNFKTQVQSKKFGQHESEGFVLSAADLNLEESSSSVLILDKKFEVGKKLADIDFFNDFIFDISITPNRADCFSILGIAREIAILLRKSVSLPKVSAVEAAPTVKLTLNNDCLSYSAAHLKVIIGQSNFDIRLKLIKSGIRPINNVVDITNYCMIALGQPMHAFDRKKIGNEIIVRNAICHETILALNENQYVLNGDLVISDESSPIAIAGIIGGKLSEIDDNTDEVILESAFFNPDRIRVSSRSLKVSTESSYRFERGVDPNLNEYATYYAIGLLKKYAHAEVLGIAKIINKMPFKLVDFTIDEVNEFLGSSYDKAEFYNMGFEIKEDNNKLIAVVPTYRFDIENLEDIAEEVVRIVGYDKLKSTMPYFKIVSVAQKDKKYFIRETLKSFGLFEVINYSFVNSKKLKEIGFESQLLYLKNPLTLEQDCMRNTLFLGLMNNLVYNLNRNIKSVGLFEIGEIFDETTEQNALGILMYGTKPITWYTKKEIYDFYDLKGSFESVFALFENKFSFENSQIGILHPNKTLKVYYDGNYIGYFGEVHPKIYDYFDIKFSKSKILYGEILIDKLDMLKKFSFKPLPKFPIVFRDLNIVVSKEKNTKKIQETINSFVFIYKSYLIDIYDTKDKKSLTFRMELQNPNKTFTDDEIEASIEKVYRTLRESFDATIRG